MHPVPPLAAAQQQAPVDVSAARGVSACWWAAEPPLSLVGIAHEFGGESHSGWLPPGAAVPLPAPIVSVTLDVTIESESAEAPEDGGFLLIAIAKDHPEYCSDFWFTTLEQAEEAGLEWFGFSTDMWQEP